MSELASKLRNEFLADEDYAYGYYNDFQNVSIATQLRVIREQRGYKTQTSFAQDKKLHQEQISLYENVDNNSWTLATLRKFARALGVTVRVSFESFSTSIETIASFDKDKLKRPSRIDDLSQFVSNTQQQADANQAMKAVYDHVMGGGHAKISEPIPRRNVESLREKLYEASVDQSSASDMAFSAYGAKPEREGARSEILN